eukprot:COSAG02_NODE_46349_length_349_cov_1.432000_1_plen_70_part_01
MCINHNRPVTIKLVVSAAINQVLQKYRIVYTVPYMILVCKKTALINTVAVISSDHLESMIVLYVNNGLMN